MTNREEESPFREVVRDGGYFYVQTKKFASGMTAECGYSGCLNDDETEVTIYPFLTIYHKRKRRWPADERETTGRDGLEPAIWAASILDGMAMDAMLLSKVERVRFCVEWLDPRRRDVYGKFLGKRGFYFTMSREGTKCLEKIVTLQELANEAMERLTR